MRLPFGDVKQVIRVIFVPVAVCFVRKHLVGSVEILVEYHSEGIDWIQYSRFISRKVAGAKDT